MRGGGGRERGRGFDNIHQGLRTGGVRVFFRMGGGRSVLALGFSGLFRIVGRL